MEIGFERKREVMGLDSFKGAIEFNLWKYFRRLHPEAAKAFASKEP